MSRTVSSERTSRLPACLMLSLHMASSGYVRITYLQMYYRTSLMWNIGLPYTMITIRVRVDLLEKLTKCNRQLQCLPWVVTLEELRPSNWSTVYTNVILDYCW